MIDINLLPQEIRKTRKKDIGMPKVSFNLKLPIKGGIFLVVGVFIIAIGILIAFTFKQQATINKLKTEIATMETELRSLDEVVNLVNDFKAKQRDLQHKISVVEQLNTGRLREAKIADNLADCLPDYMWLTSVQQKGNTLEINGITFSIIIVSDFIDNLEKNRYFNTVNLKVIEKKRLLEHDIKEFKLSCSIAI
jgi:type IV pilus assembly protein PilN